ncbi:Uncharacterised protein [Mycobacteroides abscessus subsp. abscessus]|nr:Uncharacterised protein [Mycobacteroides abscessus subsp. abscessus]
MAYVPCRSRFSVACEMSCPPCCASSASLRPDAPP